MGISGVGFLRRKTYKKNRHPPLTASQTLALEPVLRGEDEEKDEYAHCYATLLCKFYHACLERGF